MTEQEKIERAVSDYETRCRMYGSPTTTPVEHFGNGVAFALSELCPARMAEFSEWVAIKYDKSTISKDIWSEKESRVPYSTKELLEQYSEHLKHNQDAG